MTGLTLATAAERVGVDPSTLRRWVREELVPLVDGRWTSAAVAHARIVARLRDRGYSLSEIRIASQSGRLAYGYMEELFPDREPACTIDEAAQETGLDPALIERIYAAVGFPRAEAEHISEDDLQLLRYVAAVLQAGLPLAAFLQLLRVYGQAIAAMADAEVKLFHLYVHEPLIRDGVSSVDMAEEMQNMARDLMPLASPMMDHVHQRFLAHFLEQDVIGHLETEAEREELDLGRLRVGIAFADLAGYTRLTEEAGEEEALDIVERFVAAVRETLPEEARVIKTIGDEVMIVSTDTGALCDWAVGFQQLLVERPLPRIGLHAGAALYRDGDYYGRAVNTASRVAARAAGGEVLVTDSVVAVAGRQLEFDHIGEVKLKGITGPTALYLASAPPP